MKLFVNGKFTECFHFPILWHFPLCLMHVSIRFCSLTVTLPIPLIIIWQCLFYEPNFRGYTLCVQEHPLKGFVLGWIFFLLFLSAHFQIVSTVTIKLLHHFDFVCVLILGYVQCIFHITEAKYMFCILWCISLKGSVALEQFYLKVIINFCIWQFYQPCRIILQLTHTFCLHNMCSGDVQNEYFSHYQKHNKK